MVKSPTVEQQNAHFLQQIEELTNMKNLLQQEMARIQSGFEAVCVLCESPLAIGVLLLLCLCRGWEAGNLRLRVR